MRAQLPLGSYFDPEAESRFWEKVRRSSGCWEWIGAIGPQGYGHLKAHKRNYNAHRFSWMLHNAQSLDGNTFVRHTCGNRMCVNPAHLYLQGRAAMKREVCPRGEAWQRSVDTTNFARGERQGSHKLTELEVRAIIEQAKAGEKKISLARKYGVSKDTIYDICFGVRWAHLDVPRLPRNGSMVRVDGAKRRCPMCKVFKDTSEWREKNGYCIECRRAYAKEYQRKRRASIASTQHPNTTADPLA